MAVHTVKHRGGYISVTATEEGVMVTLQAGAKLGAIQVSMLTSEQAGMLATALEMAMQDCEQGHGVTS